MSLPFVCLLCTLSSVYIHALLNCPHLSPYSVRSLEFWFNHLYNHEGNAQDPACLCRCWRWEESPQASTLRAQSRRRAARPPGVRVAPPKLSRTLSAEVLRAHYQPWGLLRAARPACPGLADELLLLLQPLALLPFSLDLLFQHRLRQRGRRQRRHKELLRGAQALLLSARSTLQLARAGPGERAEGVGAAGAEEEQEEDADPAAGGPGRGGPRGGQSGWWYQLMQSSQVYIEGSPEGSRFPRGGGGAGGEKKGTGGGGPPPREGVVEGAEACPATEEATGRDQSWPSWMGSPPDSVLAELRCSREREGPSAFPAENETEALEPSPGGIKWGHLFGSRKAQREARPTNR